MPPCPRLTPGRLVAEPDCVVLRTPLLPLGELLALSGGLRAPQVTEQTALAVALADDRVSVSAGLARLADRPDVAEALYLSSRALSVSLEGWHHGAQNRRDRRLGVALYGYMSRMSTRATPFGTLAGNTFGRIAETTDLTLPPPVTYRRWLRIDPGALTASARRAGLGLARCGQTRVYLNRSAHLGAGRVRFVRTRDDRRAILVALPLTPALETVLTVAADPVPVADLVEALGQLMEPDEAQRTIDALVARRLLIPETEPPALGEHHAQRLAVSLGSRAPGPAIAAAATELAEVSSQPLGGARQQLESIRERLAEPLALEETALGFHAELRKPAPGLMLDRRVAVALLDGVELLWRLQPHHERDTLAQFRAEFRSRYGERQVSLLEAVDPQLGIDLDAAMTPQPAAPTGRDQHLLRLTQQATRDHATHVELTDADVEALTDATPRPLPDAFAVLGSLAAADPLGLRTGDWSFELREVIGPSGARMLGRFCEAEPELATAVRAHLEAEERRRPGVLFAEIGGLPSSGAATFLWRPALRRHEIEYLGAPGAAPEDRLLASDLILRLAGEELELWSRSRQCQVVPRATTAFNFSGFGTPVLRLLSHLQAADRCPYLTWDWGLAAASTFLPGVRRGRFILSRPQWRLNADDVCAEESIEVTLAALRTWRERWQLPRWVRIVDRDQGLVLDLENAVALDLLRTELRAHSAVVLTDFEATPDRGCVRDPSGVFHHELVIPFVRSASDRKAQDHTPMPLRRAEAVPAYLPGSDWLEARLVPAAGLAEQVVREVVAPLAAALRDSPLLSWHYDVDRSATVSLRLHGEPRLLLSEWLTRIASGCAEALADGRLRDLAFTPYRPEPERFGGTTASDPTERALTAFSAAAIECITSIRQFEPRWMLALLGVHRLLDAAGAEDDARATLLADLTISGLRVAGDQRTAADLFGSSFRAQRATIIDALGAPAPGTENGRRALAAVESATLAGADTFARLRAMADENRLDRTPVEIAAAHLEPYVRRMLPGVTVTEHLRLYDHLGQAYVSLAARARGGVAAADRG